MRKLITGSDLPARLAKMADDRERVTAAVRAAWTRSPTAAEVGELESWLKRHGGDRRAACEDLVWALAASAEFRFNY